MKAPGLREADLAKLPKGDAHKCVLAWSAHRHSMVSHAWLSERLMMSGSSGKQIPIGFLLAVCLCGIGGG